MTDDLLDSAALAALLGVERSTISQYRRRRTLPDPDVVVGRSPAWRRSTIEAWRLSRPGRGAGGGRPRKEAPK